jgi:kynureninase
MSGWWGQDPSVRFQMLPEHQPARGALSFQLSNPAVLPVICLRASLELFHEAGMARLRAKSRYPGITITTITCTLYLHTRDSFTSLLLPRSF